MPGNCVVPGCTSADPHRFQFPSDPQMNLKWRIAIRKDVTSGKFPHKKALWKPSISSRVCGAHFNQEDFKSMYSITTTVRCDKESIIF